MLTIVYTTNENAIDMLIVSLKSAEKHNLCRFKIFHDGIDFKTVNYISNIVNSEVVFYDISEDIKLLNNKWSEFGPSRLGLSYYRFFLII